MTSTAAEDESNFPLLGPCIINFLIILIAIHTLSIPKPDFPIFNNMPTFIILNIVFSPLGPMALSVTGSWLGLQYPAGMNSLLLNGHYGQLDCCWLPPGYKHTIAHFSTSCYFGHCCGL